MSRYPKLIILILFLLLAFLTHGCYTAFTHPPVKESQWGDIYVSDDCLECHDSERYSTTVLPESAQDDYNWQFYSGSAWWQDEDMIVAGDAPEPSGTGPRNVNNYTPQTAAPVSMPVQGGGSLGKTNASNNNNDSQEKTTTRSAGRRSHTTPSSSSQDNSSKRSRKR